MLKAGVSLRVRILAIAGVPSVALLAAGSIISGALFAQGIHARHWANLVDEGADSGITFTSELEQERRLTLLAIAGDRRGESQLEAVRHRVDSVLETVKTAPDLLTTLAPALLAKLSANTGPLVARLIALRQQVDAGHGSAAEADSVYSQLIGMSLAGVDVVVSTAPDTHSSMEVAAARTVFDATEAFSRAVALSAPAIAGSTMPASQLVQFDIEDGYYRSLISNLNDELDGQRLSQLKSLSANPAWHRLASINDAIVDKGATATSNSVERSSATPRPDFDQWQNDSQQVNRQLLDLFRAQDNFALTVARKAANSISLMSILDGSGVLALAIAAPALALWLSRRLIRRLMRLRDDSLSLANEQIPDIMSRLRKGQQVDLDSELSQLDYGTDEIGEVAEAFNRARHAVVSAAVIEGTVREGVRVMFVNLANRTQTLVHKQLEILDSAEHAAIASTQLDTLFQLDHLATRERRNAENLIILGGDRPGRSWRVPVPLIEVVRSAIAESQDYTRVRITNMPALHIVGTFVADLAHLLAELVDNATLFSPPASRVAIGGKYVRDSGVVIDIIDQGLGMSTDKLAEVNNTLANPPDFSLDSLSIDSRLGLFVVAQLALHNQLTVRFTESVYGGIRATVTIPNSLVVGSAAPDFRHARLAATSTYGFVESMMPADPASVATAAIEFSDHHNRDRNMQAQLEARPTDQVSAVTHVRHQTARHSRESFAAIEAGTRHARTNPDNERGTEEQTL